MDKGFSTQKALDAEFRKIDAFVDYAFGKDQMNEADDDPQKKVRQNIDKLRKGVAACKDAESLDKLIGSVLQSVSKLNEADEYEKKKDDDGQQASLDEVKALLGQIQKELKKNKQPGFFKKASLWAAKWCAVALLLAGGVQYGKNWIDKHDQTLLSKAAKATEKAVELSADGTSTTLSMVKDVLTGTNIQQRTETLVKVASEGGRNGTTGTVARVIRQNKALAKSFEAAVHPLETMKNLVKGADDEGSKKVEKAYAAAQQFVEEAGTPEKGEKPSEEELEKARTATNGVFKASAELTKEVADEAGKKKNGKMRKLAKKAFDEISDAGKNFQTGWKTLFGESADKLFLRQKRMLKEATNRVERRLTLLEEAFSINPEETAETKAKRAMFEIWKNVMSEVKSPEDAVRWYADNKAEMTKLSDDPEIPLEARTALKKAMSFFEYAMGGSGGGRSSTWQNTKAFLKKHWLKIVVLVFFVSLFTASGVVGVGAAAQAGLITDVASKVGAFVGGGWAVTWRVFVGFLTMMGLGKLVKSLIKR